MTDTEHVPGPHVDIEFTGKRCIHSRMCVLGRPDVFVPNAEGAWIHPEAATAEEIVELAHACPSGAIGYRRHDGGPQERTPVVNLVRIRENGPYALHAELDVAGDRTHFRATLCRCGASRNKPYCDGSHHEAGFVASGEPDTRASEPLPIRNGLLRITPTPDGPLRLEGAMEVVSGTGRTVDRKTEAYLCRCGASGNKPFCDGSHKRVGFTDQV